MNERYLYEQCDVTDDDATLNAYSQETMNKMQFKDHTNNALVLIESNTFH